METCEVSSFSPLMSFQKLGTIIFLPFCHSNMTLLNLIILESIHNFCYSAPAILPLLSIFLLIKCIYQSAPSGFQVNFFHRKNVFDNHNDPLYEALIYIILFPSQNKVAGLIYRFPSCKGENWKDEVACLISQLKKWLNQE